MPTAAIRPPDNTAPLDSAASRVADRLVPQTAVTPRRPAALAGATVVIAGAQAAITLAARVAITVVAADTTVEAVVVASTVVAIDNQELNKTDNAALQGGVDFLSNPLVYDD